MNYTNNSENEAVQTAPKLMENLRQISGKAYLLLIVLGLAAFGFVPFGVAAVLILGGWIVVSKIEGEQALREAKARAATYANMIGPYVMGSESPDEDIYQVAARAATFRDQLRLSGNPYADKIKVIEYPYSPVLSESNQLLGSWSIYRQTLAAVQHSENIKWYNGACPNELKALFASTILPRPPHEEEQPFTHRPSPN